MNTEIDSKVLARRIRRHVVDMTNKGKSSHVASGLSIADLLAVLYGGIMNFSPEKPDWKDRDRFILSKGHAGAAIYATLAEMNFFPLDWLQTHYQNGSKLSGHISHKGIPGVELSTGSLGHGLNVGAGMALSAKRTMKNHRVFVLLSDGEMDEGSNWEAMMFAAHHKLDNLVVLIDYNKIQSLASVEDTLGLEPLADKLSSFGWNVKQADGHDHLQLFNALTAFPFTNKQPNCLICHTTKGKGVSFMENTVLWHYRTPQDEEYIAAIEELDQADA